MPVGATVKRSLALGRLGVDVFRLGRQPAGPGRDAARRVVAERMGRMRGLPQKIGQILSLGEIDTDVRPFTFLTDAAEAIPAAVAFQWIAHELGRPVGDVFRRLDAHGAAASLGQVHSGTLHDGRACAVKIQYPEVRESIDADLAALGWLAAPLSASRSGFDLSDYRREMRASLLQELDYERETAILRRFAARAAQVPDVVTPVPLESWCTSRLITMSWVDGAPVHATASWPSAARHEAAVALLRFFLRGCFLWREVHADPHPGNVRFALVQGTARVGLVDFGCVKTIGETECDGLRRLAQDGAEASAAELLDIYASIGFNPELLEPMAARLPAVTRILFEPLLVAGPYRPEAWQLSERLAGVLGDDRWNFRFAGPASLLFLIRAFQGLVHYVRALDATIDWRRELLDVPRTVPTADRQAPAASLQSVTPGGAMHIAASKLRLQVVRNGEPVVQLSFSAAAAGHLQDLVPEDLHERLATRGINLAGLAAKTVADGYPMGDLFNLAEEDRTVRVWLE